MPTRDFEDLTILTRFGEKGEQSSRQCGSSGGGSRGPRSVPGGIASRGPPAQSLIYACRGCRFLIRPFLEYFCCRVALGLSAGFPEEPGTAVWTFAGVAPSRYFAGIRTWTTGQINEGRQAAVRDSNGYASPTLQDCRLTHQLLREIGP